MNTVETFPVPYTASARNQEPAVPALDTELFLRFPDGVCPIGYNADGEFQKRFYVRYLSDIQFLLNQDWGAWTGSRKNAGEDDIGPVLEFDPGWFSFLLPPKEATRMELFAWYWLWADGDRRFSISRYVFEELLESFLAAREFGHIAAELYGVTSEINRALDESAVPEAFDEFLLDPETRNDFLASFDGHRLWFLDLLVDYEPAEYGGREPELSVWLYRVAGEERLENVSGQILAVYRNGRWTIDTRARRGYRLDLNDTEIESSATMLKG